MILIKGLLAEVKGIPAAEALGWGEAEVRDGGGDDGAGEAPAGVEPGATAEGDGEGIEREGATVGGALAGGGNIPVAGPVGESEVGVDLQADNPDTAAIKARVIINITTLI
jgi:hypothetical protein